ncbi:serine/threonine-protein phosphatase 6 regulatory ankyrin repeat subunit B-like [Symsagittifera roscoffensis]|uniref:serine/threonine-protein phosphatase 6 regulatory ankyrin repeat subunit B-like n=1 Tax=Symsagittifera roscoffensis TaxID=84072 RepID=UPI00307BFDDC
MILEVIPDEERKSFIEQADDDGYSPFFCAVDSGHLKLLQYFRDQHKSEGTSQRELHTIVNKDGWTPLAAAVWYNQLDVVRWLVRIDPEGMKTRSKVKRSVLHYAALNGNIEIASVFLELLEPSDKCALIISLDKYGAISLHNSCCDGHLEFSQWLIDEYEKCKSESDPPLPTIQDKDGWTPLAYAVENNQLDVVRWLVRIDPEGMKTRNKIKRSVLHHAALNGSIVIASVFLEFLEPSDKCALIISPDKDGAISLHNSCSNGHLEFSQWLIDEYEKCKSESDPPLPTIHDKDEHTPLAAAVQINRLDVVRWLASIDPQGMKTRNKVKRSVLHHAALNGNIEIASVFLELLEPSDKCALFISPDKYGAISLHDSCWDGHLEFSQWLIDEYEKCKSESDPPLPTIQDKDGWTPLAYAVQNNQLDVVRWLVRIDPEGMKTRNKIKRSVLHHAALNGNIEIASVFLELLEPSDKCALFISPDKYGAISLHDSCWDGHLEFSQWLIDEYEKCKSESDPPLPTIQDKDGWTPLAYAVQNNQLDVVRWLVRIDPEGMKTRNKIKRSVLHHAALNGNIEIASVFLELLEPSDKCALFISPDKYGAISLHDSCWDGHLEFSQWLIDEYEKCKSESDPPLPTIQDKDGWTPLAYAVQNNQLDVVRWLASIDPQGMKTRNKVKRSVLHHTALNGNIEIASVLLELLEPSDKCALIISPDKDGAISLHNSCSKGHLEFSQWLIDEYEKCKSESDPPLITIHDKDEDTPLAAAVWYNQLDVVRWLASIDPEGMKTRNKAKRSVLHHAAVDGNIEIASVFLELLEPSDKCALIISPDKYGAISLHDSCSNGHLEFSQWLIDEYEKYKTESDPPFITIHDKYEDTPLAYAVLNNQFDVVRWLARIDPEGMKTRNKAKRSVLHHAAVDGHIEIASVFLELLEPSDKCALIISPDKYGAISLHDSCSNGHLEFSQWLIDEYEKCKSESDPPLPTIHDKNEHTPLAVAVQINHFDVVRWLVRIDPEGMKTRDIDKRSVLHHAALNGNIEIASVFLELLEPSDKCGLIISPDKYGSISLLYSCFKGHLEFSQWLIDEYEKCKSESDPPLPTIHDKDEETPLAAAVKNNQIDVVRWLASIDPQDKDGAISLHFSCSKGHLEFSQWLIDEYEKCKSESDPPLPTIHDKDEHTPLAAAVQINRLDVVRWLASIDPQGMKTRNKVKRSVLHHAALNGSIVIASVFLEFLEPSDKCALIISPDKDGAISLHNSCSNGHLEFSQWLIDEYEKCKSESDPPLPTIHDKDEHTPLAAAVQINRLDVVRWLASIDPQGMKTRNKVKRSVLHHAALNGNIEIASVFLELLEPSDKCALIISPDKYGAISLHDSCSNGHLEFSQWLIDEYEKCKSESDPPLITIHDKYEDTPLAAAVQINRLDVVRWLASIDPQGMKTRNKVKRSVLHHAALNGNIEIASVFLELLEPSDKCALIISPDKYGAISLHDSCSNGHLEFSQWLIDEYEKCKSESDPPLITIHDKYEDTPLAAAVWYNQLDVVRWLVRIDPEGMKTRNKVKRSVLHYAALNGNIEIASVFLELWLASIDPQGLKTQNKGRSGVLHHAAANGNIEIASVFLELLEPSDKCSLIISPDKDGAISLHYSCSKGHLEFSQWLIDEYENCKSESDPPLPTIHDKDEDTPLATAVANNQLDVVRWLVRIDPEGM